MHDGLYCHSNWRDKERYKWWYTFLWLYIRIFRHLHVLPKLFLTCNLFKINYTSLFRTSISCALRSFVPIWTHLITTPTLRPYEMEMQNVKEIWIALRSIGLQNIFNILLLQFSIHWKVVSNSWAIGKQWFTKAISFVCKLNISM